MLLANAASPSGSRPRTSKKDSSIEVRRSRIQGRGVFATKAIPKGARVIEYTGERITHDEASRRYDDEAMDRHHTFLFQIDDAIVIDGASGGNAARFANHSCEPNCESILEEDQVFIEAIRSIRVGEELTYDYLYVVEGEVDNELVELYRCGCGTASCRGTILDLSSKQMKRLAAKNAKAAALSKAKPQKKAATKKAATKKAATKKAASNATAPAKAAKKKAR